MTVRRSRAELLPNANNPRLLLRMLDCISRGIRRPRALAEVLEIDVRTVHYYTQAGEWLGLVCGEPHLQLTPEGLRLSFSTGLQRRQCYAQAVWSNPFVLHLMAEREHLPEPHNLVVAILEWEAQLSPSTAHRRASAIRALVEPALSLRPAPHQTPDQGQITLPFQPTQPAPASPPQPLSLQAGQEENPDAYAIVLRALLDSGELSSPQIRALLNAAGGQECSLSGCIEMMMRRGDGHRVDDRVVVSPGAVARRETARSGVLVALSDPLYRQHLSFLTHTGLDASGQRVRLARRFSPWDRRIFGVPLTPENRDSALHDLLVGRQLDSIPIATPSPAPLCPIGRPFLDVLDRPTLLLAFPSTLSQLAAGVSSLNPLLRALRQNPVAIRPPSIVDERTICHGGLLHPGERLPTAIADNRSLRLRALHHCPAISMMAALLLLDRRRRCPLQVRVLPTHATVQWQGVSMGGLLDVFSAFSRSRGWCVTHMATAGAPLTDTGLLHAAQASKLVQVIDSRLTLHESLFALLQEDHEARVVYEKIMILEDLLSEWLEDIDDVPPVAS